MTRPIVFLGPSLATKDARALLDADYRPPVRQGDVMRAIEARPPAIAIIDGIFKDAPTVRHREILWALSEGVPVYGAASMGALRAAELDDSGMIGVGLIYRWYRRYPLLPDDAVALTHAPAALGHHALSDALVDIRRSLSAAVRAGEIDAATARRLADKAADLPFPDRRLTDLAASELPEGPRIVSRVDQKARDAKALLRRLARHAEKSDWPRVAAARPPIVHAWLDDLRDSGLPAPADPQTRSN